MTLTPTTDGSHTLKVRARDRGGNLSAVTSYVFKVGVGAVTSPAAADMSAAKVNLAGESKSTATGITYQWRRGDADSWKTIPAADVNTTSAGAIAWPVASTGSGTYPKLVWNVAQTLKNAEASAVALDGPVQVRASFTGTATGTSSGVTFTFDRNKTAAASTAVGPGLVNLLTGDYTISSDDVNTIGGLGLSRVFNSRSATKIDAMFGPGWVSSVVASDSESYGSLSVTGSLVQIRTAIGDTIDFAKSATTSSGATFQPELSAIGYSLVYDSSGSTAYVLTGPDGSLVTFTRASTDPANIYQPTSLKAAGVSTGGSISWEKATVDGTTMMRPTRILASAPSGVTCGATIATLSEGCQALTFTYATATTATGTTSDALGDYAGRLQRISLTSWDPDLPTPAMRTISMAQYNYDSTGRLRNAWDPRRDYVETGVTKHVAHTYTYTAEGPLGTLTPPGNEPYQFTYTTIPGDSGAGRLYKVTRSALSAGTNTETVVYNIPISGARAPISLTADYAERWGQTELPVDATAIYPGNIVPDGNPATGTLPSNSAEPRMTVTYMNADGRPINVLQPGGGLNTTWYDEWGNTAKTLSAGNVASAVYDYDTDTPAQEAARAQALSTENRYSNDGRLLVETLDPEQDTVLPDWGMIRGRTHTRYTYDEGAPSGGPYDLVTTETHSVQYVLAGATVELDKRAVKHTYDWKLLADTSQSVDPAGLNLTSRTTYDSATGQINSMTTEAGSSAGTTPATQKVIYYQAGNGSGFSECDSKPRWALMPCRVYRAAQPASGPELPYAIYTYDVYGQPRTVAEKNSTTLLRTVTTTYNAAGDPLEITTTSPLGTATSKRRLVYDPATGDDIGAETVDSAGTVTARVSRTIDSLGRQTSYTDADGNVSTMTYDILSRQATANDGKGTRTYTYTDNGVERSDPTKVVDSQAGTITATYNLNGDLTTETRPDGLTVNHYYNESGTPTGLEYVTNPSCADASCTLYYDYSGIDTYGRVRWDASSFGSFGFGYDDAGRLTGTQQKTASRGCVIRQYGYDVASNRTKLTNFTTGSFDDCQSDTPTDSREWSYDDGDRVTSAGYTYDALGRTLTVPDEDTSPGDGAGNTTITYYANDLPRTVGQGDSQATYTLDVFDNRYRSVSTTKSGSTSVMVNHYADSSDSPSWIGIGATYTRMIAGLAGPAATYDGASNSLQWQISNLHGDIIATRNAGAAGITNAYITDEFGSPIDSTTPRYGYLGTAQRSSDNPGGLIAMGVRLYNPSTGRFLSVDPVYQGGANAYVYCSDDPVNCTDTSGQYDYNFDYDLGSYPTPLKVSTLFTKFRNNFNKYFPLKGAAAKLTGVGQKMDLYPVGWKSFPVKVSDIQSGTSSATWRFNTRAGHPDYPGFIRFTISRRSGNFKHLNLHIHGNVPWLVCPAHPLTAAACATYTELAKRTWAPLVTNLTSLTRSY
ncbi:RHS repeat protein [Actinoplanes campanulatus]|uniref:RHS repeat protein n=1 Tax=Actinoplanes campanulatus TaxID=113559 RepID=UPI00195469B3|nr:RHS repeat-associated core domain-containing protein [Actinoplanes capillaceus]